MTSFLPLHPDDVLFFTEVANVIRHVARHYDLPLDKVEALPMPTRGMADRLGECEHDPNGQRTIRLVMRATEDGKFVDAPRTPDDVWRTAAHELAHLRHMKHDLAFQTFELEMREAVANHRVDYRQKVLDKLVKLQDAYHGEAKIGNSAAAEAFAGMINSMLLKYELSPSDIDYARAGQDDPVIEIRVDLEKYRIAKKKTRIAWQESLARTVARAHLCQFLIHTGTNYITFVGTKSHATVAEYVYGTLVPAAQKMCYEAYGEYGREAIVEFGKWKAREPGFQESWLAAFIGRISERFEEARKAAVAEAPEGQSTALVRLDGALLKSRKYVDDKFKGKAKPLRRISNTHAEGRKRGRAAADAMTIGRRAMTQAISRKLLTEEV